LAIVYLTAAGALTQVKIKNVGNKNRDEMRRHPDARRFQPRAREPITRGIYSVIRNTAAQLARRQGVQRWQRGNYIM
jgi:hypothetical protein